MRVAQPPVPRGQGGSSHLSGRGQRLSEKMAVGYCLGMNRLSLNCGGEGEEHKEKISLKKGQGI